MHKIALIIKREYFSRVKKKSFLLMTFLVPLLFLVMWGGVIFLSMKDGDTVTAVKVIDQSGLFSDKLQSNATLQFQTATGGAEQEKEHINEGADENYLLIIPKDIQENQRVELYSSASASLFTQEQITAQLNAILRTIKLNEAGIDTKILEGIQPHIKISSKEMTTEGEKDSNAGASMAISMFCSIIIYITLFIYGAQVMRGVIEEKNNRIVEIIISSVRPFQLMMGKIIGIGLVGLTQFILWILLSGGLFMAVGVFFDGGSMATEASNISSSLPQSPQAPMQPDMLNDVQQAISTINFPYIIGTFLVYFIGGYLLYSALFAAVGSAVDNETETQQFMLPITMPLLFTYMMSFTVLLKDPNGTLAVWLSMIPFTSPIAMLVRLPFGVPAWQLALSMVLLVLGFLLTTWVASRIYRVGILMYGKKASYKELIKWFNYKG